MSAELKLKTTFREGTPEIDVDEVKKHSSSLHLIDVRHPDEFCGELGHIEGATLVTLGPALEDFIAAAETSDKVIVFVCRSGNRSRMATQIARQAGLELSFNMTGGMLRWNEFGYAIIRD